MMWFFIILGLMILFCLVMAVVSGPFPCDIKKMEAAKRKKGKKSLFRKVFWWMDDKYSSYPYYT